MKVSEDSFSVENFNVHTVFRGVVEVGMINYGSRAYF
jgi:hypothetical protein